MSGAKLCSGILIGVGIISISTVLVWPKQSKEPSVSVDTPPAQPERHETEIYKQTILGYSAKGRPIIGHRIGRGEECLLLFGGIHGNEKGTSELLENLLAEVRAMPEQVPDTRKLMIIPLLNPDGYFDRKDNLNANGVNINRNFDTAEWNRFQDNGVYAGERPFSESEALAMKKAVEDCNPVTMVAFHSQGALISPESSQGSVRLAQWFADQTGYAYFDEWDYAGTATRWFSETTGNPAITVELPAHDQSDWEIQRPALLKLIAEGLMLN